jgi:restriction system protein
MSIPDFQTLMLPLLLLAADSELHYIHDAVDKLANDFSLSDDEQSKLLPSGQQPVFYNRVGWARTYLKKAGLIEDPRRGYFQITERGQTVLKKKPTRIDMKFLGHFPEYVEFRQTNREADPTEITDEVLEDLTP